VNDYRIYVMDREGHVLGPPEIVSCATDEEAKARAQKHLEDNLVEVWLGPKLVGRFDPETPSPSASVASPRI
jgi:hypothetical protein